MTLYLCNWNVTLQGKPGFPGLAGQKGNEGAVGRDGQSGLDGFPGPQVRKIKLYCNLKSGFETCGMRT